MPETQKPRHARRFLQCEILPEHRKSLLGGSCVVISRVRSRRTILIIHIGGLITLLISTHEPPSTSLRFRLMTPDSKNRGVDVGGGLSILSHEQ